MNYLEVKNEEEYLMDPVIIKDNEGHPVEVFADQPHFLEPVCSEEVSEDTRVHPRVGDEYQVEVPNLATEEEHMELRSPSMDDRKMSGFEYPVVVGLTIPVTWSQNASTHMKEEGSELSGHSLCPSEDEHNNHNSSNIPRNLSQYIICPVCLGCKVEYDDQDRELSKSAGQDMHCSQKSKVLSCSCLKKEVSDYIPLPGMPRYSWTDEEAQTFLLGLYIFGKNLVQVMKFMKIKTMGEVLSYYYGEFYRSNAYKRWSACRKVRSRRCILGLRIFSGSRQQELLSRLLAGVAREVRDPLLEVFKTFNEGTSDFEQFILCLRSTVGAQILVEAVGIGKGKYDLTGFALDPSRNHSISARAEIPIGKACSSLSSGDIIKYLTGDFRLSKAKSNDLFWEAVWPRLLARGWHSEQPKDSSLVGKHALVFLIPGVKKYSRKKLVKGNHYFDSVSDVLRKVASEPRLIEFGVEGGNIEGGVKLENGWIHDVVPDKSTLPDKKPPGYVRPSEPGCSPELMKFTVVDTSFVQGEAPCKVRSLRNLPTDAVHGYNSSPHSGNSGSANSEEHSDSGASSQPYEDVNINQSKIDSSCFNEERTGNFPAGDEMDVDVLPKVSAFPGTMNGHISTDLCFGTKNSVCSSAATVLPVGNQSIHATNSSTEINFQFDQRLNPEPQVFLAPVSKRRRLVSSKNERTGRKSTAVNKRHYWKQADTPLQHVPKANKASAGANPFIWTVIPNSSTNITFDFDNNHPYCRSLHNVPPNVEVLYKEKAQQKHVIDLNIPQMPSDYESTASYILPPSGNNTPIMDRSIHPSETKGTEYCLSDINAPSNAVLNEQLSFNSRRQSTRSRPPTTRALEALACGFMGTKQKGGEGNFPSSSRSSRPVRRPRRSPDVTVPFPSDGEGSSSHFTDQAIAVNEWGMSNHQYQILHSSPSDKSSEKGMHALFVCPSDELIFEDESERGSNALLARAWSPGWQNADKAFAAFINGPLIDYSVNRKKADSANTSLLSPYLHFGELSVRKVFHQVRMKQLMWSNENNHDGEEGCSLFLRSIGLREYSRYLAFNHPCSHEKPLLSHLRFFPWVVNEVYFKVWRQGRTGYPLVDAGMRELWATGWLHDRIRVVVSSFFVKVLQLPWRWGMKYFWDTLLDADLESDALGWQYISGSLPDGRELDRIDNPQFEGYKFDPYGEYVRRWLPELARLPTEWIHHPWDAPESVLQAAGIELGSNYPLPIVELDEAKSRLQDALSEMWELEAASRAEMENGMEEGLGESSDVPLIAFPQELQHMEVDREQFRATIPTPPTAGRRRADQMVPSMTSSFVRAETELSADFGNSEVSRQEVPSQVHFQQRVEIREEVVNDGTAARNNGIQHQQYNNQNTQHRARAGIAPSTSEASSTWTGREGGVVPVWSPPAASGHSDPYTADETEISSRSYLDRQPQSHRLMNWSQLSQSS